jgi:hypothetical protein
VKGFDVVCTVKEYPDDGESSHPLKFEPHWNQHGKVSINGHFYVIKDIRAALDACEKAHTR